MQSRFTVASVLLGLVACDPNQHGNIAATKFGDLSHPAERGSPIDELQAACGPGTMTAAGTVVHREPYLQLVTPTSARLGWVTVAPDNERVDITTVEGAEVETVMATIQEGSQRSPNEHQMWTTFQGLEPDTVYCYALSDGAPLSERTGFRTAPDPTSTKPVRFLAFGDSGGGNSDQRALRDEMLDVPYELILHTGDLAYDSGTIEQFEDKVFDVYADLFRSLPFYPAAGNHEYNTMQGAPFREVFALPGDGEEKWYSYDWGQVHFVALDTEADYATQAAWLDQDLGASPLPWKIVYMHRPPYSSGEHGSDLRLRGLLAPIVEKHHVQLVLAGHDHDYERMIPANGVAYVVTGGGGRGTYQVGSSAFTAFSEEVIHFVYVEVSTDELVLHAIDATGVEFDSMVVPRVQP
jgi:hypothetical protein